MSLLELQNQAAQLPLDQRTALILHLQQTLTAEQLQTLLLEKTKNETQYQSWVGIGASGIGNLSERIDELLFADSPLERQK